MWMNEYDVADAVQRYAGDPVLGPATETLANLVEWTNDNSDGWPYWTKPARAAAKLMALIEQRSATPAEYRKALTPVKAFRTRHGAGFTIVG